MSNLTGSSNIHRSCNKPHGFTLVELLVVVAIIGVLAALALTAIGGMRQRANKASSASNLKQMGAAIGLYIADNGAFPLANGGTSLPGRSGQRWWPSHIAPYAGNNPKIFWRPGASSNWDYLGVPLVSMSPLSFASPVGNNNTPTTWSGTWTEDGKPILWNYWANANVLKVAPPRLLSEFTYPARTVLLTEGFLWNNNPDRWFIWPDGTMNVLWVDGHVTSENPTNITTNNLIVR